ncbi:MAG TPA: hypothetical protein VLA34_14005, partial [Candidatus Krumholzibacterium sp.]|nr:hypothetical protein [Candidatus Krumholzibacterium sp.]
MPGYEKGPLKRSQAMIFRSLMTIAMTIIAAIALSSSTVSAGSGGKEGLTVEFLSGSERLTPLYYQHGDYWCTHLKTPDILVRNLSDSEISLDRVIVTGSSEGRELIRTTIYRDDLEKSAASNARTLNRLLAGRDDEANVRRLGRLYGIPAVSEPVFIAGITLPAGGI